MQLGLNVDPVHGFTVEEILDTRAQFVRFPFWWDTGFDYKTWTHALSNNGVECMAVLDKRAMTGRDSIERKMLRLRRRLPSLYYWQIGNEPDGTEESSWSMSKQRFSRYLQAAVRVFSGRYVIAGGLISGDANWLTEVNVSLVDAIAVHPYTQTPESALTLLDNYSRWSKPIVISEFGGQTGLFNNEHERAVYHSEMIQALSTHALVGMASVFCYSDAMVDGFGLVDHEGNPKETYAAFHDSIN